MNRLGRRASTSSSSPPQPPPAPSHCIPRLLHYHLPCFLQLTMACRLCAHAMRRIGIHVYRVTFLGLSMFVIVYLFIVVFVLEGVLKCGCCGKRSSSLNTMHTPLALYLIPVFIEVVRLCLVTHGETVGDRPVRPCQRQFRLVFP